MMTLAMKSNKEARQTGEFVTGDARWKAIQDRNRAADGRFFYAVRTTGIYCQPSCTSRLPRPANVTFFTAIAEAEAAGYRACKRCRPGGGSRSERSASAIAKACAIIDAAEETPSLDVLASAAGLSPYHFHRVFKAATGITPKDYANAAKGRRVRDGLASGKNVTAAIHGAGYTSSSRFYEGARERLGMTASAYRRGGEGSVIHFAIGQCSLGAILVASTGSGICAIEFGDSAQALVHSLQGRFPKAELIAGDRSFERLVAEVVAAVEEPETAHRLPLDVRGTAFQERVWLALRAIPAGRTATYADIAKAIGNPSAVRAVARACAANPAAVAIPCHRVVRTDGSTGGYRWGVARKQKLLDREVLPNGHKS